MHEIISNRGAMEFEYKIWIAAQFSKVIMQYELHSPKMLISVLFLLIIRVTLHVIDVCPLVDSENMFELSFHEHSLTVVTIPVMKGNCTSLQLYCPTPHTEESEGEMYATKSIAYCGISGHNTKAPISFRVVDHIDCIRFY